MYAGYHYFRQHNSGKEIKDFKSFYRKFSNEREFGGSFSHIDYLLVSRFSGRFEYMFNVILKERPINILDVGCGNGVNLPLSRVFTNIKYTGVDYAEKTLEVAQKNYPDVDFQLQDIFNMDFEDESFDLAICSDILPIYNDEEDRIKLINSIKRVLSKNGILVLHVTKETFILKLSIEISRLIAKTKSISLPNDFGGVSYKKNDIKKLIKRSGLIIEEIIDTGINLGIVESVLHLNMKKYKRKFGFSEKLERLNFSQNIIEDMKLTTGSPRLTSLFYWLSKILPRELSMINMYIIRKEKD